MEQRQVGVFFCPGAKNANYCTRSSDHTVATGPDNWRALTFYILTIQISSVLLQDYKDPVHVGR